MNEIQMRRVYTGIPSMDAKGPYVTEREAIAAVQQSEQRAVEGFMASQTMQVIKSQESAHGYEQGQRDERAKHVNDNCVWGQGKCVPDCPSCKRLDDLYAERVAGAQEAIRDAVSRVEALATERELRSPSEIPVDLWDVIAAIKGE